jgi:diacylglycerol kinase
MMHFVLESLLQFGCNLLHILDVRGMYSLELLMRHSMYLCSVVVLITALMQHSVNMLIFFSMDHLLLFSQAEPLNKGLEEITDSS